MSTAAQEIRNVIDDLDVIFESEDELLKDEEIAEAQQSEPDTPENLAPKKTKKGVQNYARPKDGQSFPEKKGFTA